MKSDSDLIESMNQLGPWHHKVHVRNGIYTEVAEKTDCTGGIVTSVDPAESFHKYVKEALPDGMDGRSFLDCGCNCGGYAFAAKENGASNTYGFDVRNHWINQAKFLMENRAASNDGMRFEVADSPCLIMIFSFEITTSMRPLNCQNYVGVIKDCLTHPPPPPIWGRNKT